jgi:UV DNA damage endonuclease
MTSFNPTIKRLGFCCKYLEADQLQSKKVLMEKQQPLNTRSTTITWLRKQTKHEAERKLLELAKHNIRAFRKLVEYTGTLPANLRMVRLSSDCLPGFTEQSYSYYYRDVGVQRLLEQEFAKVGEAARRLDVRISFHMVKRILI